MSFEDRFKEALKGWLVRTCGLDVVRVTAWAEYCYAAGGCDTCGPEVEATVEIAYLDSEDIEHVYVYTDKLGELIRELV